MDIAAINAYKALGVILLTTNQNIKKKKTYSKAIAQLIHTKYYICNTMVRIRNLAKNVWAH